MTETIVPIAAGKAAALQSFLVRRGNPSPGNRLERVKLEFERKWATAPEAIREKYASRARNGATKSEREDAMRGAGINPTPKVETLPAPKEKAAAPPAEVPGSRTENARDRKDRDTVPASGGKHARSGDERGKPISAGFAPGSDEARAAALTENSANEKLATATVGNFMDMRSAVAAERGDPDLMGVNKDIADRDQALANDQAKKDDAAEVARVWAKQNEARSKAGLPPSPTAGQPPSPATPPPGGYRPIGSRAEDIAAAKGDPTKLPTDSRMVVQDKVNGGSTPVNKIPPDLSARTTNAPTAAGLSEADIKEGYSFDQGPNMEPVGLRHGEGGKSRTIYMDADKMYGKAKPSIPNTISNTPKTADPTKPVMIQGQNIEQRRADYQARSNTPQSQAAASNTLRTMGIQPAPETPKAPLPRGPASQPQKTGSSLDNPNSAFSDAAYQRTADAQAEGVRRQAEEANKPTMGDVDRAFKPGTPEHTAAAWGVNSKTGAQLTKDDTKDTAPTSSRVVSSRPATPEELRTRKPVAPIIRR